MVQSRRGSRSRRVLPLAPPAVGVCAAVAYGRSTLDDAPTHPVARRVIPADQVAGAAAPLPVPAHNLPSGSGLLP